MKRINMSKNTILVLKDNSTYHDYDGFCFNGADTPNIKFSKRYADFLFSRNEYGDALKVFTKLNDNSPCDDYLIHMALCNQGLGYIIEMMSLLERVKDKSLFESYGIDYDFLKKSTPHISNFEYIENREILKYSVLIPFGSMPLPRIVRVDGKRKYFDPVRKKGVPITPEEKVRQQVLRYLLDRCRISEKYIISEDSLAHYDRGTLLRADIVVKVNDCVLLLVECKNNNIEIDGKPLHQLMEYQQTIRSRYLLLTNGELSYIFIANDDETVLPLSELPCFDEMCRSEGIIVPIKPIVPERPHVSKFTHSEIQYYRNDGRFLGCKTTEKFAPLILNLTWFFLDSTYKIERVEGYGCKIRKDLGIINAVVTNAGSGQLRGTFRQLLAQDRFNQEQLVAFSVFGIYDDGRQGGYTSLVCAIEINSHLISKLEVRFDASITRLPNQNYLLEHSGVRSRKTIKSTLDYVKSVCPELIRNGKIFLGEFDNSDNITIDSPGAKDFIARLVSYLILRKELAELERTGAKVSTKKVVP